ncbi:MAG: malate synthase A, partial [Actinobacteria bacterium]|nr:malate synthase A [Actinomycetota bacterium]
MHTDVQLDEHPDGADVLSREAIEFVVALQREFGPRRLEMLAARRDRQVLLDAGDRPDFLTATAAVRAGDWQVAPAPK